MKIVLLTFSSLIALLIFRPEATPVLTKTVQQHDPQVEIIKQQIWENLSKVPGTERDYVSTVKLRIADGNIINADCKLLFPKSSWLIASILLDDYKDVLKKTTIKIFEVIYKLITDPNTIASEINFSGLWRPWLGSHVHIDGRGNQGEAVAWFSCAYCRARESRGGSAMGTRVVCDDSLATARMRRDIQAEHDHVLS